MNIFKTKRTINIAIFLAVTLLMVVKFFFPFLMPEIIKSHPAIIVSIIFFLAFISWLNENSISKKNNID